jgi:hypothetical protein
VDQTAPTNGGSNVTPEVSVTIHFNTAMSGTTVLPSITVTPLLTTTQVYSYYRDYENTAE